MRCWVCGAESNGTCRFCGRAICKQHAKTRAFLFEAWERDGRLEGLAVEDALHCGVCRTRPAPVGLEFLRQSEREA